MKYLARLILFLFDERMWPYTFGLVAGFVCYRYIPAKVQCSALLELPGAVISIVATGVGFLGVTLTLVMTMSGAAVERFRQYPNSLERLVDFHVHALVLSGVACIVSLFALALKAQIHSIDPKAVNALAISWTVTHSMALFLTVRVLRIFVTLAKGSASK